MEYLKSKLEKYVNLQNIKILKKNNKKIISTCVYIPGELEYNERSIYYFQGLVKSVETFDKIMNNSNNNTWTYRIYYDKLFDSSLKSKSKSKKNKKFIKKLSKKSSNYNDYDYIFNNDIYKINNNDESKKKIITNLNKNKEVLKKLIKMYHLYLKNIRDNKKNKYNNIELIRYDCPKIKKFNNFVGHNSSFGMFLRFCPLLDKNVDLFYSVNSTHPITPQLKYIIDKWVDSNNQALAFCYETKNVINSSKHYVIDEIEEIKNKMDNNTVLNDYQIEYKKIVDQIFNINILSNLNSDKFHNNNNRNEYAKNILKTKLKKKYNFNKIKKIKKSTELNRLNHIFNYDKNIKYSYKYLLYDLMNNNPINLEYAIGGGAFGIKKTFPTINYRYEVFINFIILLIENKKDIKYGLDELLLKMILLPDIFIFNTLNKKNINIIDIYLLTNYVDSCSTNIQNLFNSYTSYLEDSEGDKIIFKPTFLKNIKNKFPNFFDKSYLNQLDHCDSRALYITENTNKDLDYIDKKNNYINKNIIINLDLNKQLCFDSIFLSYNETKKLLILDSNVHNKLSSKMNIEDLGDYFELLYIDDYNLLNISLLLNLIIYFYNINIIIPKINIKYTNSNINSNSNSNSNTN